MRKFVKKCVAVVLAAVMMVGANTMVFMANEGQNWQTPRHELFGETIVIFETFGSTIADINGAIDYRYDRFLFLYVTAPAKLYVNPDWGYSFGNPYSGISFESNTGIHHDRLTFTQAGTYEVLIGGYLFQLVVVDGGSNLAQTQNDTISVTIGNTPVNFADQAPTIVDGRTLVPVRGVFEALGFEVDWDPNTNTAIITNADYDIRITIGSDIFTTNGVEHTLDVPAQSIGGRTMVPIRLPLESVGIEVDWDGATSTVVIATPQPTMSFENWGDLGVPSDPSIDELRRQLAALSIVYHLPVDGRPAFVVSPTERAFDLEMWGDMILNERFTRFGDCISQSVFGYMREIDGRIVFLIFAVMYPDLT